MRAKIPVSVLITVKNEEKNLPRCLAALERFDEIIVIDSNSIDATADIARSFGATVIPYIWNGTYPKKRQWCLDTLSLKYDRIFFVDADEEVTPDLCNEIAALDWTCAGYFVKGAYVIGNTPLRFGLKNNKLCLFDRLLVEFPVVDDLDIPGMGEMEGHYQPVLKSAGKIGTLQNALLHYALEDEDRWATRHNGYRQWQNGVEARKALPQDPSPVRRCFKYIFHNIPARPLMAFIHSYLILAGFLDGVGGYNLAKSRFMYYRKYQ